MMYILRYISHLETVAKIRCDAWYAHFLTGPTSLPPKDSRRDAKACQAKRLKINKEMQTFMKDSKSSRKAAGIPRQNKKMKCALFLTPVLECHAREMESFTVRLQSMSRLFLFCIPGEAVCDKRLIPNYSKSLRSKVHSSTIQTSKILWDGDGWWMLTSIWIISF